VVVLFGASPVQSASMASLATASLSDTERRVLERLVQLLKAEFGAHLKAVWLYGSRARGERPEPDSDVDLLVVSTRGRFQDDFCIIKLLSKAAEAEGVNSAFFSPKLYDPELIAQRREIRSFFMQEVDRDKIVLFGEP
jgi:predicted nucleotidyltransferase